MFVFLVCEKKITVMKKTFLLLLLLVAEMLQAQTVNISISNIIKERNGKQFYIHTVQKGQTVYSIAKAYNVSIKEIYFENPNAKQGIVVGQKIWIPTVNKETEITQQAKQSDFDFFYHIAARNETFKHIGSIYLIPERYIVLANPGLKEPLREGEYVKVPVESAFPILDGHPVQSARKNNSVEDNAHNFAVAQPNANVIPKYKPPVVNVPVVKQQNVKSDIPIQSSQPNTSSEVSFNPDRKVIPDYRHVVVMGETLKGIAKKYGISVNDLKSVNPGLNIASQGQRLRLPITAHVPGYTPPVSTVPEKKSPTLKSNTNNEPKSLYTTVQQQQSEKNKPEFYYHKVKKKETLYSISREYGVSLDDIYKANNELTPHIKIGQIIMVPKKKISTDYIIYSPPQTIRLKKLAKLYRVSFKLLKRYNPFLRRKVFAGQQVKIPVGEMALIVPEEIEKQIVTKKKFKSEINPKPPKYCRPHARFNQRKYKVALMIPLYLQNIDSLDIDKFMLAQREDFKPFRFIKFLEGALMAVDSLRKAGMHLDFYVYDVDDKLTKTAEVLSLPEIRNMDLIIGPFFSTAFNQVALFAGQLNIPIVNPLTFREEVVSNYNNVIKIKPGQKYLPDLISNIVKHYYYNNKVFLISQTSYKDAAELIKVQNSVRNILPETVTFPNSELINLSYNIAKSSNSFIDDTLLPTYSFEGKTVDANLFKPYYNDSTTFTNNLIRINYITDSLHPFMQNASVLRNNLVIIYGNNKAFIMDVMNRLNRLTDTFNIKIIGLPLWEHFSNIDNRQLDNLQALYPASMYIDYTNDSTLKFINGFKSKYFTEPEAYGFTGFDITWFFGNVLFYYGRKFENCLPEINKKGITTIFRFKPSAINPQSFENSYWNVLQIKNKHLIKLP